MIPDDEGHQDSPWFYTADAPANGLTWASQTADPVADLAAYQAKLDALSKKAAAIEKEIDEKTDAAIKKKIDEEYTATLLQQAKEAAITDALANGYAKIQYKILEGSITDAKITKKSDIPGVLVNGQMTWKIPEGAVVSNGTVFDAETDGKVIGHVTFDEATGEHVYKKDGSPKFKKPKFTYDVPPVKKPQSLFEDIPVGKVVPQHGTPMANWEKELLGIPLDFPATEGASPDSVKYGLEYAQHVVKKTKEFKEHQEKYGKISFTEVGLKKSPHGEYPALWDAPHNEKWAKVKQELDDLIVKDEINDFIASKPTITKTFSDHLKMQSENVAVKVNVLAANGMMVGSGTTVMSHTPGEGVKLAPAALTINAGATVVAWQVVQPHTAHVMLEGTFPTYQTLAYGDTLQIDWPQKFGATIETDYMGQKWSLVAPDGSSPAGPAQKVANAHPVSSVQPATVLKEGPCEVNLYLRGSIESKEKAKHVLAHALHVKGTIQSGNLVLPNTFFQSMASGMALYLTVMMNGLILIEKEIGNGGQWMEKGKTATIAWPPGGLVLDKIQKAWKTVGPAHNEADLMCACWGCQGPPKPHKDDFVLKA